jgi:hypothetical protein
LIQPQLACRETLDFNPARLGRFSSEAIALVRLTTGMTGIF